MPKERIDTGFNGGELCGHVTVGWSKQAEYAQIGVGRWGPNTAEESIFIDFSTRNQINALIRNLRSARDQAFGRDE